MNTHMKFIALTTGILLYATHAHAQISTIIKAPATLLTLGAVLTMDERCNADRHTFEERLKFVKQQLKTQKLPSAETIWNAVAVSSMSATHFLLKAAEYFWQHRDNIQSLEDAANAGKESLDKAAEDTRNKIDK